MGTSYGSVRLLTRRAIAVNLFEEILNAAFCRELTQSEIEQLERHILSGDASLTRFVERCQLEADLHICLGTARPAKCLLPSDNSRNDPGGPSEPHKV
jgi:hypothetical protein